MKKHKSLKAVGIGWIVLTGVLLFVPIKVKQAVDAPLSLNNMQSDISMLVGQSVALLCEAAPRDETDPPDYDFVILGCQNKSGQFDTLLNDAAQNIRGLYVKPRILISGAVKNYNYGDRNQFVLRGTLKNADCTVGRNYRGGYLLELKSWDVVYPIYHWEWHLGRGSEFYDRNLFLFDLIL